MSETLVIQPSGLTSQDTYAHEGVPTTVYGNDDNMVLKNSNVGAARRIFIKFDLSEIPAGATIESATMELYWYAAGDSDTYAIKRVDAAWDEDTLTWNNQPGAYGPVITSNTIPAVGWLEDDLTAVIQAMVRGDFANTGFILYTPEDDSLGQSTAYTAQYATDPTLRPKLTVVYTPSTDTLESLFDMTLRLSRKLQSTVEGTADDGSSTTLVDALRTEGEKYFIGGTVWFLSSDNALKTAVVTGWAEATGTFTFGALSNNVLTGDLYAAAGYDFPLWLLRQAINAALKELGEVRQYDISLTTVANQEAYDLPDDVRNIKRVEVATNTSAPLDYQEHFSWHEQAAQIVFETGHAPSDAGYTIRLTYNAPHATVRSDGDPVSDYVDREALIWTAAVHAYRWKRKQHEGDEDWYLAELNEALVNAARFGNRATQRARKDPRHSGW